MLVLDEKTRPPHEIDSFKTPKVATNLIIILDVTKQRVNSDMRYNLTKKGIYKFVVYLKSLIIVSNRKK